MAIKIQSVNVIDDSKNIVNVSSATFVGTSHIKLPIGTTAQRPESPTDGMIRFNADLDIYEGYQNGAWGVMGGDDGTGGGAGAVDDLYFITKKVVTENYTIVADRLTSTFGPITIADGITVTVPNNCIWRIV